MENSSAPDTSPKLSPQNSGMSHLPSIGFLEMLEIYLLFFPASARHMRLQQISKLLNHLSPSDVLATQESLSQLLEKLRVSP